MTEQTRIPVPDVDARSNDFAQDGDFAERRDLAAPAKGSLIERAAGPGRATLAAAPPPVLPLGLPRRPVPQAPVARQQVAIEPITSVAVQQAAPATAAAPMHQPTPAASAVPRKPIGPRLRIDRAHLREQGLIEPDGPINGLLEEFRIIKRQLLLTVSDACEQSAASFGRRILICSAHPGEGKTFCAVNLALSIAAEKDNEVLLVDADVAKPSVLSTLGLPGGPGLMDALADPRIAVEDCIMATDIPGFYVLPAGNQTGSDTEYLASSRTEEVLDRLDRGAPNRIVIFDSPPALAASPASELAMHVGQAVMVVRADRTGEAALRDALNILSGCDDIRLLLNCTKFSPTGRAFGSYYGYNE
jgi:exopolysaccharide/PEP-CTERM locus tyrosine autokinase